MQWPKATTSGTAIGYGSSFLAVGQQRQQQRQFQQQPISLDMIQQQLNLIQQRGARGTTDNISMERSPQNINDLQRSIAAQQQASSGNGGRQNQRQPVISSNNNNVTTNPFGNSNPPIVSTASNLSDHAQRQLRLQQQQRIMRNRSFTIRPRNILGMA